MNWKNILNLFIAVTFLTSLVSCQDSRELTDPNDEERNDPIIGPAVPPLPERSGPRIQTTGAVPHVQIDVEPVEEIFDELFRLAYTLPDVEYRPTIVSLPGAHGMWLSEDLDLAHPQVIVAGREFAHIHPDGSLHAPLPYDRALELEDKKWGERHPWADQRNNWDGFVMLYTPLTESELEIVFQLIVESYNHVTGLSYQPSDP